VPWRKFGRAMEEPSVTGLSVARSSTSAARCNVGAERVCLNGLPGELSSAVLSCFRFPRAPSERDDPSEEVAMFEDSDEV
jgi:hypothetical protein